MIIKAVAVAAAAHSMVYLFDEHQGNISVLYIPPYTPLLYSKTGVCRGIPIFRIIAPKHRLWVLVRTGSNVYMYPQSMF